MATRVPDRRAITRWTVGPFCARSHIIQGPLRRLRVNRAVSNSRTGIAALPQLFLKRSERRWLAPQIERLGIRRHRARSTINSGNPAAPNRLAATRGSKALSFQLVRTGKPAQAHPAPCCAHCKDMCRRKQVCRAQACEVIFVCGQMRGEHDALGRDAPGVRPRVADCAMAAGLALGSHNTLASTARSRRIQTVEHGGCEFVAVVERGKDKPRFGSPALFVTEIFPRSPA